MTAPTLAYVPNSSCQGHLQDLLQTGDFVRPRVLRVGQKEVCDDCGREWVVVQKIGYGGIVMVEWQCYRRGTDPDPMFVSQARLDALEAANTALTARVTTAETAATALTARVATLEARTVTTRLARTPLTALVLAIGGKADATCTWTTALPDTNYTVDVAVPVALVGKVTWAVKTKTTAGVTITLTATAAVSLALGSDLVTTATRYA